MRKHNDLTRRDLLTGAASLAILSAAPAKVLAEAFEPTAPKKKTKRLRDEALPHYLVPLREFPATHGSFEYLLELHFPGYREIEQYKTLAPYLMIVFNPNPQGIKAIHARWKLHGEKRPRNLGAYLIGESSPTLGRHKRTGAKVLLRKSSYALISPFGLLASHENNFLRKRGHLSSTVEKSMRRQKKLLLKLTALAPGSVDCRVGAIISDRNIFFSPGSKTLVRRYRTMMHAEHDECYSLRQLVKHPSQGNALIMQLHADANAKVPKIPTIRGKSGYQQLYLQTKKDYARKLLRLTKQESQNRAAHLIKRMERERRPTLVKAERLT